jgi:hypothetical protein
MSKIITFPPFTKKIEIFFPAPLFFLFLSYPVPEYYLFYLFNQLFRSKAGANVCNAFKLSKYYFYFLKYFFSV